jgi:hypothetical protein
MTVNPRLHHPGVCVAVVAATLIGRQQATAAGTHIGAWEIQSSTVDSQWWLMSFREDGTCTINLFDGQGSVYDEGYESLLTSIYVCRYTAVADDGVVDAVLTQRLLEYVLVGDEWHSLQSSPVDLSGEARLEFSGDQMSLTSTECNHCISSYHRSTRTPVEPGDQIPTVVSAQHGWGQVKAGMSFPR